MASLNFGKFSGFVALVQNVFWRLVPDSLFLPGLLLPAPEIFMVSRLPIEPYLLVDLAQRRGQRIEAQLALSTCLLRTLTIPKAAVAQADAAIAVQMRQTLPAGGKGLIWRWALLAMRGQSAEFQVLILKQSQVDAVVEVFAKAQVDLVSISLSDVKAPPFWIARAGEAKRRNFWLLITLLAGLLPAIWSIFTMERQISALHQVEGEIGQRVADLKARLVAARDEANNVETKTATLESDLSVFAAQTGRLAELADLTQTLPDSVWISELTITGKQLSLSGFTTGDVAEIVTALHGLDWVASVQLEGPVSFDNFSGQNRFGLSARIKDLGPTL